jgi:CMP-N-acetylneuraminic acid synthetase
LATDTATSLDVISHAMEQVESQEKEPYDALMLLEPSSPFATHLDYDSAIEIMIKNDANVVVGVGPTASHSSKHGSLDSDGHIDRLVDRIGRYAVRQQDTQEYLLNGALYLLKWDYFKSERRIMGDLKGTYAHVMERSYSIEIDETIDLAWAEFMVDKGHIDMKYWQLDEHASDSLAGIK